MTKTGFKNLDRGQENRKKTIDNGKNTNKYCSFIFFVDMYYTPITMTAYSNKNLIL